jgi:hypothetical protein
MEQKEPYVEPTLDELGSVGDVTGLFDIGDIFGSIFGRGKKPPKGSR